MSKILKKGYEGWVINYSTLKVKTKKFINHWKHKMIGKIRGMLVITGLNKAYKQHIIFGLNVLFTGIIIHVIVYYFHSIRFRFISYGLLSAIIMYYVKWLWKLRLTKTWFEVDKLEDGTTSNEHSKE